MAHWLLKSEPAKYSWDQMVKDKRTHWDGVRNFQAANNLRAMKQGDRAFFYHSNEGKDIVGIIEIVRPFYPDPGDPSGKFGMIDVAPVMPVKKSVSLAEMREVPERLRHTCCQQRQAAQGHGGICDVRAHPDPDLGAAQDRQDRRGRIFPSL